MDSRSEELIGMLGQRFGYTGDNNRDVVGDALFPMAEAVEEITVRFAYEYIIAYLSRCDPATDTACWGT